MDNPLVTIRCLAYNHELYIRECLEGFIMQKTHFRFEAIVHDDASTDGTAAVIREYAEKYPNIIKPIFETENQYSKHDGSLRKIMDAHTHGKYVALCEGDDYWIDPYKLQKQVELLEDNADCSLCCGGYIRRQLGKIDNIQKIDSKEGFFFFTLQDWGKRWFTMPLTILFRKEMLVEYQQKFKYYKYSRDIHLIYHLLKNGNGIYLSNVLAVYHVHPGGICSMMPAAVNAINNYNCYRELYQLNSEDEVMKKLYIDSISIRLVYPSEKRYSSKKIFLKGWKISTTFRQKIKLLYHYVTPLSLIQIISNLKKRICII
ncbi:glycosyltransferase [Bacteroides sp.]|uniref:glycosyltransferase family 2 protein n=1 Tax=Bacteroides sp. TaxID=29523 RepID=UPI0026213F8C|nr:glycosyltransferase [Bacteroides sp.]MDD3037979.1 glycosyltransferase [Bacteroides sp.]